MMKQPLKCVIVDDDPQAIALLTAMIRSTNAGLQVAGNAHSVATARAVIETTRPYLIFLDIMLGADTGFNLLEQLKDSNLKVIFTTGYNEFALEAFNYAAIHYLLKPINVKDLQEALRRAGTEEQQSQQDLAAAFSNIRALPERKIALPTRLGTEFISQEQIIYCKGSGNYTELYLTGGAKKLISRPLGQLEKILEPNSFCRVHKKYLVNLNEVVFLERSKSPYLLMKTGDRVEVSYHYKGQFLEQLKYKVNFMGNGK